MDYTSAKMNSVYEEQVTDKEAARPRSTNLTLLAVHLPLQMEPMPMINQNPSQAEYHVKQDPLYKLTVSGK